MSAASFWAMMAATWIVVIAATAWACWLLFSPDARQPESPWPPKRKDHDQG